MSDRSMLGYVIHFAHDAGRKDRDLTPEVVEEILAEAGRFAAENEIRTDRRKPPVAASACRFPASWGQELGD